VLVLVPVPVPVPTTARRSMRRIAENPGRGEQPTKRLRFLAAMNKTAPESFRGRKRTKRIRPGRRAPGSCAGRSHQNVMLQLLM
jgi:hypothetical protein